MWEIDATDAKKKFDELLDRVEQGEEMVITRYGMVSARLIPANSTIDRQTTRTATHRIRERAERLHSGPFDWNEWKVYREARRP